MRGTFWENMKNMIIAVLVGILAANMIEWRSTFCMWGGGYLFAQMVWVMLISYDEIIRKRNESKRKGR